MTYDVNIHHIPVILSRVMELKDHLKFIGQNIRAARKNKNLTIETLSELIGISPSFLGTLERGESSLSVETLVKVCRTLDISADSIIIDNNQLQSSSISDKKDIIATLLNKATDEELDYLIDYIKFYRDKIDFKCT